MERDAGNYEKVGARNSGGISRFRNRRRDGEV